MSFRPAAGRRSAAVALATTLCILAASCGGSGGGGGNHAASTAPRRPNIVTVMTDDQTVESLRVMTHVHDLIAEQGATFAQNIVSFPLCCPSRATYFTGQYAKNDGVHGNGPPYGGYQAFEHQDTTFVAALAGAGYDTIHIGKYLNGYGARPPVVAPPGWKHWFGAVDPSTYQYYGFTLLENGKQKTYAKKASLYQTDVLTDIAVSQIRRAAKAGSPFFLDVAYLAPHVQVKPSQGDIEASNSVIESAVPAPQDAKRYADEPLPHSASYDEADVSDKPQYVRALPRITPAVAAQIQHAYDATLGSLLAVDRGVQRIVDTLRDTGQLDRTYILFTSDNGFLNGEHRITSGKTRFYEPSIRVPLLVRGPTVPHGVTRHALVANIDLAPTILDLTHVAPLRTMDGRSFTPLFKADSRADRSILLESGGGFLPSNGVRTPRYAYFALPTREYELYDLQTDPDELHNVYGDPKYASVQADMQARLQRLKGCAGATCN